MERKTAWYITFSDRTPVNVYSEEIVRQIVNRTAKGTKNGTVTRIQKVETEWWGSHDDNSRNFREIGREDVPVDSFR